MGRYMVEARPVLLAHRVYVTTCCGAENLRNVGNYTLQLQAMLNESGGVTVISGKHLPSHVVHFSITGQTAFLILSFSCVGKGRRYGEDAEVSPPSLK